MNFDENRILTGYTDEVVKAKLLALDDVGRFVEVPVRFLGQTRDVLIDDDGNVLIGA
jgi:hypothetical protein